MQCFHQSTLLMNHQSFDSQNIGRFNNISSIGNIYIYIYIYIGLDVTGKTPRTFSHT